VHGEIDEAVGNGAVFSGKEGRADAIGAMSEAQIKRGGLNLSVYEGERRGDGTAVDHRSDFAVGENTLFHRASGL
jgi:hypothetical protein